MGALRLLRRPVAATAAIAGLVGMLAGGPVSAASALGPPVEDGGGSLVGVVTAQGEPVPFAWVRSFPVTPAGRWAGAPQGVLTDASGRFEFPTVAAGQVKVHVRAPAVGGWSGTYWPQAFTFAEAGILPVGRDSRADVAMAAGWTLRGRVVDARTGVALPGAVVSAHAGQGMTMESVGVPALAADALGSFALADLPPVPVILRIDPPPEGDHLTQWYADATAPGSATLVEPTTGTEGLLIGLEQGASIAGIVRDEEGQPVAGASVALIGCRGCPLGTVTDAAGEYQLRGVAPGAGMLLHVSATDPDLMGSYYRAAGDSWETWLRAAAGERLDGIDVELRRGARLVLHVTNAQTGAPVQLLGVELQSVEQPLVTYRGAEASNAGSGRAGATPDFAASDVLGPELTGVADPAADVGTFAFGPVPAGDYRLRLFPGAENRQHVPIRIAAPSDVGPDGLVTLVAGDPRVVEVRLDVAARAEGSDDEEPAVAEGAAPEPVVAGPVWPLRPVTAGTWPGLNDLSQLVLSS